MCRELCPSLLKKSDRGKFYDPTAMPCAYGTEEVHDGVEGVELLEMYERGEITIDSDGKLFMINLLSLFLLNFNFYG